MLDSLLNLNHLLAFGKYIKFLLLCEWCFWLPGKSIFLNLKSIEILGKYFTYSYCRSERHSLSSAMFIRLYLWARKTEIFFQQSWILAAILIWERKLIEGWKVSHSIWKIAENFPSQLVTWQNCLTLRIEWTKSARLGNENSKLYKIRFISEDFTFPLISVFLFRLFHSWRRPFEQLCKDKF
jgi:hypothetical protein